MFLNWQKNKTRHGYETEQIEFGGEFLVWFWFAMAPTKTKIVANCRSGLNRILQREPDILSTRHLTFHCSWYMVEFLNWGYGLGP